MRVTDANDGPDCVNAYSYWPTFNINNTRLLVHSGIAPLLYRFDPVNFAIIDKAIWDTPTPIGGTIGWEDAIWSGSDPDVIYAQGLPATLAVRQLTGSIPIVFTQLIDPVVFGLAESLGHPGGNVTGFVVWDFMIAGKWVQLLHELLPDLAEVGLLFNPDTAPYAAGLISAAKQADRSVRIVECPTRNDSETETILSTFVSRPGRALLVIPEPFTNGHRDHIIATCARLGLPAINSVLGARENGALMSYTFVWDELIRAPVEYIDRILKGARPRDLPIQAPRRYELVVNLKTAKALNREVPLGLLVRADEVVE